jgi:hypothetical protein
VLLPVADAHEQQHLLRGRGGLQCGWNAAGVLRVEVHALDHHRARRVHGREGLADGREAVVVVRALEALLVALVVLQQRHTAKDGMAHRHGTYRE